MSVDLAGKETEALHSINVNPIIFDHLLTSKLKNTEELGKNIKTRLLKT